ncbi:MAG: histidyl-tRNA synthetase [Thermoleophilaceae bacterium]|nr:histidyl-tRNA synthetase [Thermoleophilaceae bacterium]
MAKIRPISGFPEWLPEQRLVEQQVLDGLRSRFELFGFAPVETRSVEPLDTLLAKGETDKEIYVLRRLGAEEGSGDTGFGLHYDLTVPFARYAVQHYSELTFPFKRYQIQRAWRGERPQEGRYREFLQADIDVIDRASLALHFDAEMPWLVHETLASLPFPAVTIHVNNRKVTEGFMRGLGIQDVVPAMRVLDKADKVGPDAVRTMLLELGLVDGQIASLQQLVSIEEPSAAVADRVRALGVSHPKLDEGLEELRFVMDELAPLPPGAVTADMGIVRGFDYYTGTVYEGVMQGHEALGAVCSGGRYDNLAAGAREPLPGVGISIGVSRILGRLFGQGLLPAGRKSPTVVLVAQPSADDRAAAIEVTRALRLRGIAAEVYHEPAKLGKQVKYADSKGIPYVWLPFSGGHEVRDMASGEQVAADAGGWTP